MTLPMVALVHDAVPANYDNRRAVLRRQMTTLIDDVGQTLADLRVYRMLMIRGSLDEAGLSALEDMTPDAMAVASTIRGKVAEIREHLSEA